jgi:hypothetical protein
MASNLRKVSLVLAWATTFAALAYPVMLVFSFYHRSPIGPVDDRVWVAALYAREPAFYRYAALGLTLIPAGFTFWVWWSLSRLMFLYAKGQVFTQDALHQMHNIALALLGAVIAGFVFGGFATLVLSWPKGPIHRTLDLTFDSNDIADLFKAAIVYVIALVMNDALRIADENAKFV